MLDTIDIGAIPTATKARAVQYMHRILAEKAYDSFRAYIAYVAPWFEFSWHHLELIEHLEEMERGDCDRMIITLPPQHAKSTLASILFPCWYLGKNPGEAVVVCSAAARKAQDFSDNARHIVNNVEHRRVFGDGAALRVDAKAKDLWKTQDGSSYLAVGVGGMLTGWHADLAVIDDALKSKEDATSDAIVNHTMNWYHQQLSTRFMGKGKMLSIGTRWSERDLIQHQLDNEKNRGWRLFHYPAISKDENGKEQALWEERQPLEELQLRREMDPDFECVYQGNPTPEDGTFFPRKLLDQCEAHEDLPESVKKSIKVYGATDQATVKGRGDYTVHVVGGMDSGGVLWILDLWRGQQELEVWAETMLDMMEEWKTIDWAEEGGTIRNTSDVYIRRRQKERKVYGSRDSITSDKDKETRARPLKALMSANRVRFYNQASWLPALRAEMITFPAGKHDDQVDALSLLVRKLDMMRKPLAKKVKARGRRLAVGDAQDPRSQVRIKDVIEDLERSERRSKKRDW